MLVVERYNVANYSTAFGGAAVDDGGAIDDTHETAQEEAAAEVRRNVEEVVP